ncbi:hypothetical protein LSTR_LSTR012880 [Laodelphax striatellus]|uniref:Nuclear pore complex protein Nup214 phenylalanine-glycine (FG) domain-containing protein n=1 Tax=Laodelphax striatellus TaxID=195883 RepID=A0A482WN28_LAOST|nr:hypothetical protein LSTR_LSTR012880 [Laodelphax striatellus]
MQVIQVSSLESAQESQGKSRNELTEYPRRDIQLPSQPSQLAVNCDGTLLAVVVNINETQIIRVYSVAQFLSQTVQVLQEVRGSTTAGCVTNGLSWNPGIANMLAVCFSDGSASVYEFKGASYSINSIPPEAKSTCMCWSPKGKQIVIGSQTGTLTQYKPELKAVKNIQAPDMNQRPVAVVSVQWLSSFQFAAVYKDLADENQKSNIMLVNTPKNGPVTFVDYEDICYSSASLRSAQFYLEHVQAWNLLLVASANSMEVGVLGIEGNDANWTQWILEDSARAELPLDKDHQETLPIGMTWNTNSQHKIPIGENQFLPPMPLFCVYSHKGSLCVFLAVNLLNTATQLCSVAELPADQSGLSLFVTSEPISTLAPSVPPSYSPVTPTSISPEKQITPVAAAVEQGTPKGFQLPFGAVAGQSQSVAGSESAPKTWDLSFDKSKEASVAKPATSTATASGSLFGGTSQGFTFPTSQSAQTNNSFSFGGGGGLSFANPTNVTTPSSNLQPFVSSTPLAPDASKAQPQKVIQQPQPQQQQQQPQQKPPQQAEKSSEPAPPVQEEVEEEKPEIPAEVVQAAFVEEIKHFDSELRELLNDLKINETETYEDEAQSKLNGDLALLEDYFKQQMESTKELQNEVKSLKMAGLELVGYVEDSKRRLHQHKKPGFKKLIFSNEIDPMNMRRLESINKSMLYVESQLEQSNKVLDDKWAYNQDQQKPIRNKMFVPPGEELYLTVINQTNILNSQKKKLDELKDQIKDLKEMQSSEPSRSRIKHLKTSADLSQLADNLLRVDLNSKSSSNRSRSSLNTSSSKPHLDATNTSRSILDDSKDFNESAQIPSDVMVRRIPKVITQSPLNMTGKERASLIAESLVHNHKICNTLVSKTVSSLSPPKFAASKTPTKETSSSVKSESVKNGGGVSNTFKQPSEQSVQSKTLSSDGVKAPDFSSSLSIPSPNQSEMSFFKTPTKQPEPAATKPLSSNFETPISKNQSNRENMGSASGFYAVSSTAPTVERAANSLFGTKLIEKQPTFSSGSGTGVTQEGKSPLASISNLLEGISGPKPDNKTTPVTSQPLTSFVVSTKTDKTPPSSLFGGLKSLETSATSFSFTTPTKTDNKPDSTANSSFFKGVNLFAGGKSEGKGDQGTASSPFSSNTSFFAGKPLLFGASASTPTTGASSAFSLDKPIFGGISATTTTTSATPTSVSISTTQESAKVDTATNMTFGKASEKTAVSSTKEAETEKTGLQTNLMFGGGSLQKTTDSKSNVFAFQPSTGFSFAQPPKETADKVEGSKLVTESSSTPVSGSDSAVKTTADKGGIFGGGTVAADKGGIFGGGTVAADKGGIFGGGTVAADKGGIFGGGTVAAEKGGIFGGGTVTADKGGLFGIGTEKGGLFGASTVSASPVSFSFTQSLANAAVSSTPATPTQETPATTAQPGSTLFPVISSAASSSSTTATQPTSFSSLVVSQGEEKVTSTVSDSSTVSATETVTTTSVAGISFSNFNFGSSSQPATSDTNAKMTLNFSQSGGAISGSIFGGATTITPVQSPNVFGETAATTAAAPFSFSISDSSNANTPKTSFFGSKPLFGNAATSQPASTASGGGFFGSATTAPTPTTKPETTGLFGQGALSPFGQSQAPSAFGGAPTFGQPAGGQTSLFGQTPSSGFGSQSSSVFGSGGSIFGGGTATDATANQQTGGPFSSPAAGGLFGNSSALASPVGSFSQPTSPSISQTGFGTAFQNKPATFGGQPAFGAASSFGGAPTFGGSPTFGSPNKVFGSPQATAGFGASTQQSTTFENLANQNTPLSFGNLAQQNQSPGFGSTAPMFGSPQQSAQSTPPAFPNTFGGNSFSSWR